MAAKCETQDANACIALAEAYVEPRSPVYALEAAYHVLHHGCLAKSAKPGASCIKAQQAGPLAKSGVARFVSTLGVDVASSRGLFALAFTCDRGHPRDCDRLSKALEVRWRAVSGDKAMAIFALVDRACEMQAPVDTMECRRRKASSSRLGLKRVDNAVRDKIFPALAIRPSTCAQACKRVNYAAMGQALKRIGAAPPESRNMLWDMFAKPMDDCAAKCSKRPKKFVKCARARINSKLRNCR